MSSQQIAAGGILPDRGDRRLAPRVRVSDLVYVDLGPGNGGMVLDVCEGGLTFQAVQPLEKGQRVRLSVLLPGLIKSLGTDSQIVWLNDSSNGGGLRFLDLREADRREIRRWVALQTAPPSFQEKVAWQFASDSARGPQERPVSAQLLAGLALPDSFDADSGEPVDEVLHAANFAALEETSAVVPPRRAAEQEPVTRRQPQAQPPSRPAASDFTNFIKPALERLAKPVAHIDLPRPLALYFGVAAGALVVVLAATLGQPLLRGAYNGIARLLGGGDRSGLSDTAAAAPAVHESAASPEAQPLQVEILQQGGKRWMLALGANGRRLAKAPPASHPRSPVQKTQGRPDLRATSKRELRDQLILQPKVPSRPSATNPSVGGAPSAPAVSTAPSASGAATSILVNHRSSSPQPPDGSGIATSNFQNAVQIRSGPVVYPDSARHLQIQGDVRVHVTIGKDGIPRALKVISGPPALRQAGLEAVRDGRYRPAMLDGAPVEQAMEITIAFRLDH